MELLNKLSIRARLITLALVVFVGFIIIALVFENGNSVQDKMIEHSEEHLKIVHAIDNYEIQLLQGRRAEKDFILRKLEKYP